MTSVRICFLGDSLIVGTNDHEFTGWPGRLAQRETAAGHDISIYNLGIRADTSDLIAARWRAECEVRLPDFHPGALVFSYGANDMAILDGKIRVPLARSLELGNRRYGSVRSPATTTNSRSVPAPASNTISHATVRRN